LNRRKTGLMSSGVAKKKTCFTAAIRCDDVFVFGKGQHEASASDPANH
jgi:hypothetical protein